MASTNFSHSLSAKRPFRIFHISISVCSERIRAESCCAAISSEKKSTGAPRGTSGAGFHVLRIGARGVERHIGGERSLSHAGAAGENDEIGGLKTAEQRVDIGEAGDKAGDCGRHGPGAFLRQFHRAAQAFGEVDRPLAVFRAFADAVERLLRLFDLVLGRLVVRRFIRRVDDVLADMDQRAAHREIVRMRARSRHWAVPARLAGDLRDRRGRQPRSGRDRPSSGHAASAA